LHAVIPKNRPWQPAITPNAKYPISLVTNRFLHILYKWSTVGTINIIPPFSPTTQHNAVYKHLNSALRPFHLWIHSSHRKRLPNSTPLRPTLIQSPSSMERRWKWYVLFCDDSQCKSFISMLAERTGCSRAAKRCFMEESWRRRHYLCSSSPWWTLWASVLVDRAGPLRSITTTTTTFSLRGLTCTITYSILSKHPTISFS